MGRIEAFERGQLQHAFDLPFEDQRQHQNRARRPVPQAGRDLDVVGWQIVENDLLLFDGTLSDDSLAQFDLFTEGLASFGSIAGQQCQLHLFRRIVEHVELGLAGRDHGAELGKHHAADVGQIALTLQHAAKFGQVGFQPILLAVLERGVLQVANHLIDRVFQRGHFALGVQRDRTGQVALGDGGGHFGDRTDLAGEVVGELIDVFGEGFPGAGGAGHLSLSA